MFSQLKERIGQQGKDIKEAIANSGYDYGSSRNGFGLAYRTIKPRDVTVRHLRINSFNVEDPQIISQLPLEALEQQQAQTLLEMTEMKGAN